MNQKVLDFARKCVTQAKSKGVSQSEAFCTWGREFFVSARNGETENLKQSTSTGVGFRVIKDGKLGFGFTSDISIDAVETFVEKIIALSVETASDKNNLLATGSIMAHRNNEPDIYDEKLESLDFKWKIKSAIEMEKVALAYDKRIVTVSQVGIGDYISEVAIVTGDGLEDSYKGSYLWAYCVPFAQDQSGGQTDYWQDLQNYFVDLDAPERIAEKAAKRVIANLGAKKIESGNMPVVFDPDMSKSFISGLVGAVNGDMIFKKASFLYGKLNKKIASDIITIVDDGMLDRKSGSAPFDGEGVPIKENVIIKDGLLKMYLYDAYTAKKAGTISTGNATRDYSSLPSIGVHNFYMKNGNRSPKEIIGEIDYGLYITGMMGKGVNVVNGDFSRGATGKLIVKGELTSPVQEITVAGNMVDMLQKIDAVGNDIDWRGSVGASTIRFSELSVSGK